MFHKVPGFGLKKRACFDPYFTPNRNFLLCPTTGTYHFALTAKLLSLSKQSKKFLFSAT
jgi:hypothetical protein